MNDPDGKACLSNRDSVSAFQTSVNQSQDFLSVPCKLYNTPLKLSEASVRYMYVVKPEAPQRQYFYGILALHVMMLITRSYRYSAG